MKNGKTIGKVVQIVYNKIKIIVDIIRKMWYALGFYKEDIGRGESYMYPVQEIARYIIWYCKCKGYIVSNLKLQKILYFVQAEFLVAQDRPCFDAKIEAWTFGPVVPEIYKTYKIFGNAHIPCAETSPEFSISESDKKTINGIVDTCSEFTASQLVEITHCQAPWINAYKPYQNNEITIESLKSFFIN